jgi:hypothetical protein
MPDSQSLLIVEGPAAIGQLTVVDLTGAVKGVARLDKPFSAGAGYGVTVDRRGARAVVVTEARDAIGGRRRLDLALVDLTTGRVTPLVPTPDADESAPLFTDDDHLVFSRRVGAGPGALMELTLGSGALRRLSPEGEDAKAVGIVRDTLPVYAAGRPGDAVTVYAITANGGRVAMGHQPAGTAVWSVDPRGTRAVVTGSTAVLRAVTLKAPA